MRRYILRSPVGLGLMAGLLISPLLARGTSAQEVEIVDSAITLSGSGLAELWFELDDDSEHRLRFDDGAIELDGASLGSYDERGALAAGWRDFLREHAGSSGADVQDGLLEFRRLLAEWETSARGADGDAVRALGDRLDELFELASEAADVVAIEVSEDRSTSLQIVPGGLGFDVTGQLDRLREALRRLGDAGASIDDQLAMIVHGDYRIPADREVEGDIALLDGTLRLAGEVEGDVLVLDGSLVLAEGARIQGNVLQVGGDLELAGEAAIIEGEILSDVALAPEAPVVSAAPEAPVVESRRAPPERSSSRRGPWARFSRNVGNAAEGLMGALSTFACLAALGLLLVYFAQGRLETVSDTVRHEFARSFAMGLAGQILFFPALLVLVVLVITWPVVPFFVLAAVLAGLAGYVAVAHGAGEMFARRRYRYEWLERLRRSNSYYYVLSGLVLLLLPFAAVAVLWVLGGAVDAVRGLIVFVATVGTWILATAGFGSVLLTRAGGRSVVVDWPREGDPDDAGGEPADPAGSPDPDGDDAGSDAAEAEFTVDESDDA